ncbi:uncharacterized protein ACA1_024630, partial [Acanthamoeba castellanii str. Neff]
LDSEVKTAKQVEEEERRRREERIIDKKKEHLKSIEVLIDQLELPDDEEEELVSDQGNKQSPAALRERQEYDAIQRKYKELLSLTGQPLWTSAEGTKVDSKVVTATVKKTVDQAKGLADSPSTSPDRRDVIIGRARDCVTALGPFLLAVKALNQLIDDMRACRRPMDRPAVDASIKDVQGLHSRLMQAYEALLESYMYSTGAPSGKSAPSSRPPDASPDPHSPKPPQEFTGEQAKNAILYSFRDFYLNTAAPPAPDTLAHLSYVPWQPTRAMREYCSDAIQLFKPIVEAVNSPLASLHFRSFADLVTKEIELLVPIAKMIQHDRYKYAAFDKFPLGIKVFINSVVVFVDAVSVYKQRGGNVELSTANHRKDELTNALKMLLATIRKVIDNAGP